MPKDAVDNNGYVNQEEVEEQNGRAIRNIIENGPKPGDLHLWESQRKLLAASFGSTQL